MRTQDGQPVIHGVFVHAQQPSRGPATHAFRQAVAPRKYVVASVRMPAYAVPVRADTNPGQT